MNKLVVSHVTLVMSELVVSLVTLGPVKVMEAGMVVMMCVEDVYKIVTSQ